MNSASTYAKALEQLVEKNPAQSAQYLKNLRASLARRGHEKLLPRILSEYIKLQTHEARMKHYKQVTPAIQQTDKLLQLYKRLVSVK